MDLISSYLSELGTLYLWRYATNSSTVNLPYQIFCICSTILSFLTLSLTSMVPEDSSSAPTAPMKL
jgi:hypothetical protein